MSTIKSRIRAEIESYNSISRVGSFSLGFLLSLAIVAAIARIWYYYLWIIWILLVTATILITAYYTRRAIGLSRRLDTY